ncbi:MAG: COX15/CtaA family protein [Gammaproteobacteria bacterium]
MKSWFTRINLLAVILAFGVVTLGAYVRLSDAGLGCPDWPGCYGQLLAPHADHDEALEAFPGAQIDTGTAWTEMIHRYVAGILGLLILALALIALVNRRDPGQQVKLPLFLVLLVTFQALLGMWTVTHLVAPNIVTLHLLMGMLTLGLLWWQYLKSRDTGPAYSNSLPAMNLKPWAMIALAVVFTQIALGGWVSTNYAALHCADDFPKCQESWWPPMEFEDAFDIFHEPGVNYEGGQLESEQRVAIHVVHRIGAVVTLLYIGLLGLLASKRSNWVYRGAGHALLFFVVAQFLLGISNVIYVLPLPLAVAHNGGAALLLLSVIYLNYKIRQIKVSIITTGD